jgi:DNA-binding transcriptional regulator YiaG
MIEHVHVLAASLGNLRRMLRRCEARAKSVVAAFLRCELALDAIETARKALLSAARCFTAAGHLQQTAHDDGWPQGQRDFGAAVRRAREAAGLSRAQLATRIGVVASTIRNVEKGAHRCTAATRALLIKTLVKAPS